MGDEYNLILKKIFHQFIDYILIWLKISDSSKKISNKSWIDKSSLLFSNPDFYDEDG